MAFEQQKCKCGLELPKPIYNALVCRCGKKYERVTWILHGDFVIRDGTRVSEYVDAAWELRG